MNKEEFLRKARKDHEYNDPYENEISSFSWKIAAVVALALSFIVFSLEWIFLDKQNLSMFFVIVFTLNVKYILKAIKIRCTPYIVYSIILSVLSLFCLIMYVFAFLSGRL